jgi:hypothetical protein
MRVFASLVDLASGILRGTVRNYVRQLEFDGCSSVCCATLLLLEMLLQDTYQNVMKPAHALAIDVAQAQSSQQQRGQPYPSSCLLPCQPAAVLASYTACNC